MSGIEIYVKNEEEKTKLIETYLEPDNRYLRALDALKEELKNKGIDTESPEGKKIFILEVRKMNDNFI